MKFLIPYILTFSIFYSVNYLKAEDLPKIGLISAMSGELSEYGLWVNRGIELALLNHKTKAKVFYEDTLGKPLVGISSYNKLRNFNKVNYFISAKSSTALSLKPLIIKNNNILIDVAATTPLFSEENSNTFRTGVLATQLTSFMAKEIFKKHSKIACLYIDNEFGHGMMNSFKESYKGEILFSDSISIVNNDYTSILLKIKQTKASAIWFVGHHKESSLLLNQANKIALNLEYYTDLYSVQSKEFKSLLEKKNTPVKFVTIDYDNIDSIEAKKFRKLYLKKYGEKANFFSAQAYDALFLYLNAFSNCDDTLCIQNEIKKANFSGASGLIKFDKYGDVRKNLVLKSL